MCACVKLTVLVAVQHEREKRRQDICVFARARAGSLSMCACVCVHTIERSGEEARRLCESLNRMSEMRKNTMKEPERES